MAPALAAVLLLCAPPAAARGRGYSVEAAAGVSQGSSIQTSYDAHPYHPFRDFGQSAPKSGKPAARAALVDQAPTAQDPGDKESHPERMGIDPTAVREEAGDYRAPGGKGAVVGADQTPEANAAEAAANFPTLVQAWFVKNGRDGVWTDGAGAGARRFTLFSAEVRGVRKVKPGLFSAPVLLRELPGGKPVVATAVADCSQAEWRIVSLEPSRPKAPAQR